MNQILFIRKHGAYLKKEGNSLLVLHQGKRSGLYPLENVESIVLMGPVEISSAMIKFAAKRNIQIVWTDTMGVLKAMIKKATGKNITVRILQYKTWLDQNKRLNIAKECVRSKIANLLHLTKKFNSPVYAELRDPAKNAFASLDKAESVEQVRGIEGGFAAVYFRYFPGLLIHTMGFKKRTKRPPKDPVNAMLSFGYTILFLNIFSLLETKGMDPFLGFLHDIRYGHPALASDLVEPFRFCVDKAIIELVNREWITPSHFEENEGVTMTKEGLKVFTRKIREAIHETLSWDDGEKLTPNRKAEKNLIHLIRYMAQKENTFHLSDWK